LWAEEKEILSVTTTEEKREMHLVVHLVERKAKNSVDELGNNLVD
jgi:hypothetical protein